MQEADIATLVSRTFFVDSHYTPFTDPEANHKAFAHLAKWVCTCGEVDRSIMSDNMSAVNKVWYPAPLLHITCTRNIPFKLLPMLFALCQ